MEIVLYSGLDMDGREIQQLARDAAASVISARIEPNVRVCRTREELFLALKEAARQDLACTERFFPFKTTEGLQLLRLSQVVYFKSSGHRVIALLADGRELTGRTLRIPTSTLLEPLRQGGQFYQILRSTFVNKLYISEVGPAWVRLKSGAVMNVSHKYYQALLQEYGHGTEGRRD